MTMVLPVHFLYIGRSENRRPPRTTAGWTADHHRTWKI